MAVAACHNLAVSPAVCAQVCAGRESDLNWSGEPGLRLTGYCLLAAHPSLHTPPSPSLPLPPTILPHRPSHQSPALITPQISDHIRLQYFSVKQRRGDQWCDVIFICVTARAVSVLQFPIKVTGKSSTSPDFYCGFIIVLLRVRPRWWWEVMILLDNSYNSLRSTELKIIRFLITLYFSLNEFLTWTP